MSDVGQPPKAGDKDTPEEKGIIDQLRGAIKKEIFSQVAKYTIGAVVALACFAALGWWLYIKSAIDNYIVFVARGVPIGAIMAFDLPEGCPEGWAKFDDGAGKVIIGANQARPFRIPGGADTVTLKARNLPQHQHETMLGVVTQTHWGEGTPKSAIMGAGAGPVAKTALTSGELVNVPNAPDPVQVMPPYLPLTVCKRKA